MSKGCTQRKNMQRRVDAQPMRLQLIPSAKKNRFSDLSVTLQHRNYTEARDASNALLLTFTGLLTTLIGEGLTTRLLCWVRADSGPQPAPEIKK